MRKAWIVTVLFGIAAIAALPSAGFARNRMYHPTLGQFLQRDPAGTPLESPITARNVSDPRFTWRDATAQYAEGMNLYLYVGSNPLSTTDPSGKQGMVYGRFGGPWDEWKKSSQPVQVYNFEALAINALYAAFGSNNLPPEKAGKDFAHSRDYCCQCVPVAKRKMNFAMEEGKRYNDATGNTAAEVEGSVSAAETEAGITTFAVGGTHPIFGVNVPYPSSSPCPDLVYQAIAEHERSHWNDRNAILSEYNRSLMSTWRSGSFHKQREVKAYGVQASFYQDFINECKTKFPEASFE
ncbi:MAG: hypothetical protein NTY65_16200 [Planctomycetota bacterium]|nr:hypothetical protein [Planctomycetota bacterium]